MLLLKSLPENVDILCTHPMFGPESEKQNIAEGNRPWENLNFQFEKVRRPTTTTLQYSLVPPCR